MQFASDAGTRRCRLVGCWVERPFFNQTSFFILITTFVRVLVSVCVCVCHGSVAHYVMVLWLLSCLRASSSRGCRLGVASRISTCPGPTPCSALTAGIPTSQGFGSHSATRVGLDQTVYLPRRAPLFMICRRLRVTRAARSFVLNVDVRQSGLSAGHASVMWRGSGTASEARPSV